jgi:hypothetical protein
VVYNVFKIGLALKRIVRFVNDQGWLIAVNRAIDVGARELCALTRSLCKQTKHSQQFRFAAALIYGDHVDNWRAQHLLI